MIARFCTLDILFHLLPATSGPTSNYPSLSSGGSYGIKEQIEKEWTLKYLLGFKVRGTS